MPEGKQPTLRIDAARNVRRILNVARTMLTKNPEATTEEIAQAAGVGIATIYRRFRTREDLIRAVLQEIFTTEIGPILENAKNESDPRAGVFICFEAALRSTARGGGVLATVPATGAMTIEMAEWFVGPVSQLIRRGQQEGVLRADIDPESDTLRLLLMLLSVVPTLNPESEGWKRYLRLMMDALSLTPTVPLPPAEAVVDPFRRP
jgi:AcrR family transcriptional regulator